MIFIVLLFQFAIVALVIAGMWKTYTKANQPGWACIIPIYNYLVLADIAKVSRNQVWKALALGLVGAIIWVGTIASEPDSEIIIIGFLLYMLAIIGTLIFLFPVYKGVAINFGQTPAFAWGLMLLGPIFYALLGFGTYQYQADGGFQSDDVLDSEL